MRGASLERASHGSLLDSLAFEALRDRGTTRCPTIPRQGSGRRVSVRLAVTRPVIAGDHSRHLSETVKQRATGKRLVAPEPGRSPSFIRDYHDSALEGSRGVSMRAWPRSPNPDATSPEKEIRASDAARRSRRS